MIYDRMTALCEDKINQVDKDWIEGIRKGWKKWAGRAHNFDGYAVPATAAGMVYETILQAAQAAETYLKTGRDFIRAFREDLLINKGFWTRPNTGPKGDPLEKGRFTGMKGKAVQLLRDAEEAISDGLTKVEFWRSETHPVHGYRKDETWKDLPSFNKILITISLAAKEAAQAADKVLSGKLLRHLSTLVGRSGEPLDFGFDPSVLKIGDATVVFQDTVVDPARFAVAAADDARARHPSYREDYIKYLKRAKALLARRKLGFLWYGRFEILPRGEAPVNPYGTHFGTGAEYFVQGDFIKIYNDPKSLDELIVHELGHRYFFKFMSSAARGRFGEWFGKVPATSTYGAMSSVEDFAEVFSAYVRGQDMTRDQIDRFKAVLGKEHKESLRALAVVGRSLLAERVQPFREDEVKQLRKDFLLLMKNVDLVKNYEEADKLRGAFLRWTAHYETLLFKQLIPKLPEHIGAKLHIDRAELWQKNNESLKDELEKWVAYWDKRLRENLWGLQIAMSLPLEQVTSSKWAHYKTMGASWDASRDQENDAAQRIFDQYLKEKDKWSARAKRKARPAWAVLNEYLKWLEKPATIEVPSDDNMELEGFKFRLIGADKIDGGEVFQDVIPKLRLALKRYRARAMKVFPWVIKNQLRMELIFDCALDWAGRYVKDHILVCVWAASAESPESIAHVVAHEMGHHVWKTYLGANAREFWTQAIKVDRGELDLVKLAAVWEREAPTGHLSDLEKYLKEDPVLFLQVETLTLGHGNYGKSVFFSLDELKELIAKGTKTYPVPNNPITAYASKNPEEAFCEAFGYLVSYGPRSVLPLVRSWLRTILPEIRTEEDLRDLTSWGRSLLNEAAEGDCFRFAYKRVQEGGTLIHATVVHPWSGKQFPHAWVEDGGKAYDWQTSQGLGKGKPLGVAAFRQQWKPAAETSYTADEASALAARTKHFGPWAA